jgi:hypothetical protein
MVAQSDKKRKNPPFKGKERLEKVNLFSLMAQSTTGLKEGGLAVAYLFL